MPLRVASVWLALAVALLSSLMPGGLPRSTALGSAFNPATTAVALQPTRTPVRVLVEQIRRDDDPTSGQGGVISLPLATVRPAERLASAAETPKPAARIGQIEPHAGLDGSPRGPPLT